MVEVVIHLREEESRQLEALDQSSGELTEEGFLLPGASKEEESHLLAEVAHLLEALEE